MLFYVLLPDKKMQMKTETSVISPGGKGQIVSFLIWIMDPPTGICSENQRQLNNLHFGKSICALTAKSNHDNN